LKTILFFKPSDSSFIRQDEVFLKKRYSLYSFTFPASSLLNNLRSLFKQWKFLSNNIKKSDLIYIWFADYHALLPLLFGGFYKKKSVLIIGGYDAAKLKEFNYGGHINPVRSWIIKQCCNLATKILPVSSFVLKNLVQNIGMAHPFKTKIVYNGADTLDYCFDYSVEKKGVICISGASDIKRIKIKGLDFFAKLASGFPEKPFTIVGVSGKAKEYLMNLKIPNLVLIEWINKAELKGLLNQAEIICQFSRYESFGLALAEGMLCGCIPITVRNIGPEEIVANDVGIVIEKLDLNKGKEAIKRAFKMPWDIRNRARFRVINQFSLKAREDNILKTLKELE